MTDQELRPDEKIAVITDGRGDGSHHGFLCDNRGCGIGNTRTQPLETVTGREYAGANTLCQQQLFASRRCERRGHHAASQQCAVIIMITNACTACWGLAQRARAGLGAAGVETKHVRIAWPLCCKHGRSRDRACHRARHGSPRLVASTGRSITRLSREGGSTCIPTTSSQSAS
jgi:hypothetical protein